MAPHGFKHGHTSRTVGGKTPEYRAWYALRGRCKSDNRYIGRDITVCRAIQGDFVYFLNLMGSKPGKGRSCSIDRIDNGKGYWCGVCGECVDNGWIFNLRWATASQQARNRRSNKMITFQGKTQCLAAWAEEVGTHQDCLSERLIEGWTIEEALTTPIRKSTNGHYYVGQSDNRTGRKLQK